MLWLLISVLVISVFQNRIYVNMERLHNPGHKMAAKNFSSVTLYSYRREGSLKL